MSEDQNGGNVMGNVNCLRCHFRHEDNGNCTAVGGFCTAVQAAHCPLLRQYLDTGMTPEAFQSFVVFFQDLIGNQKASEALDRFRQLVKADRAGQLAVLPCKVGDTVYILRRAFDGADVVGETKLWWDDIPQLGKTVFLTREEAEKALEAMKNE